MKRAEKRNASPSDLAAVRDLLTYAQVAEILKVKTTEGARDAVDRMGCRVVVVGNRHLVPRSELDEALASRLVLKSRTPSLKSPLRKSA